MKRTLLAIAVASTAFVAVPAFAQVTPDPAYPAQEEEDEFPWGLLGLLGLAGLMGMKRRDNDHIRRDTTTRP